MAISKVDRDTQYMKEMWGTTRLVTDYTPVAPSKKPKSPSRYNVSYTEYDGEWV